MLEIKNLYFAYSDSPTYLLSNLSLTVKNGDYVSILGENGCGKSTLVKMLLKLLTPQKGSINSDFKRIGYVPQRFENFNSQFPLTVYELLNSTRKVLKLKDREVIDKALAMVKMEAYKGRLVGTLSGGQFQKILIAKALIGSPDLLILDEPSTGIDVRSQGEIYSLIKDLNINNKLTIISIEHNIDAALYYSSYILHVKAGEGKIYYPDNYSELQKAGVLHVAL